MYKRKQIIYDNKWNRYFSIMFALCASVYCYSAKSTGVETLKMNVSIVSKSMDGLSKHIN